MKILDNPVYVGKIAYGRNVTEKIKGSRDEYKRVRADDYMAVDGMHEAIIDQETWEAARLRRKETGVKWNKTHSLEHEHILSGLIKCPIFGTGLVGTLRRRKFLRMLPDAERNYPYGDSKTFMVIAEEVC